MKKRLQPQLHRRGVRVASITERANDSPDRQAS